jgi:hypothetical protein
MLIINGFSPDWESFPTDRGLIGKGKVRNGPRSLEEGFDTFFRLSGTRHARQAMVHVFSQNETNWALSYKVILASVLKL